VTDKALEQIVFRTAHSVVHNLVPYPAEQRAAMLSNVVRIMLAAFLEAVAGADSAGRAH
jgi:hypothetical protein